MFLERPVTVAPPAEAAKISNFIRMKIYLFALIKRVKEIPLYLLPMFGKISFPFGF